MPPFTVLTPQAVLVTAVVALTASSNPAHGIEPTDLFSGSTSPVQFLVANRAPINGGLIPTDITPVQQKSLSNCREQMEAYPWQTPPPASAFSRTAVGPVQTLDIGTAIIKISDPAVKLVQSAPGVVELDSGELLISTSANTTVRANGTIVTIAPGTLALINVAGGSIKVLNAREETADSLRIATSRNAVTMGAGRQALTTGIDTPVAVARVSLWAAYRSSGLMRSMVRSADPNNQALSNELIKMAAVFLVARSI